MNMASKTRIDRVAITSINAEDRLRPVDPQHVANLRASIMTGRTRAHSGLISPIEVRREGSGLRLVTGAHRLAAIMAIGDSEIDAVIIDLDPAEARLREIDENLVRRDLSPWDRAVFLAERAKVWLTLYPDTEKGTKGALARWYANDSVSFASDAADKTGFSQRTVQRDIKLADALWHVAGRIRGTWLASDGAQLKALAKVAPGARDQVLDLILDGDQGVRGVDDAFARIMGRQKVVPTAEEKAFAALLSAWTRAPAGAKAQFLDHIGATLDQAGEPA